MMLQHGIAQPTPRLGAIVKRHRFLTKKALKSRKRRVTYLR
jgi:hypothetical protein